MLHFIFFVFFTATIVVPQDLLGGSDVQLFQDDLTTLPDSSENSLALAGSGDATNPGPLVIDGGDDVSLFADPSSATTDSSSLNVRLSGFGPLDFLLEASSCLPKDGGQQPSSKLRARDGGRVCAPTGQSPGGGIDDDFDEAVGRFDQSDFFMPQDTLDSNCPPQFPKKMCCTQKAVLESSDVIQDYLDCVPGTYVILFCRVIRDFLYNSVTFKLIANASFRPNPRLPLLDLSKGLLSVHEKILVRLVQPIL